MLLLRWTISHFWGLEMGRQTLSLQLQAISPQLRLLILSPVRALCSLSCLIHPNCFTPSTSPPQPMIPVSTRYRDRKTNWYVTHGNLNKTWAVSLDHLRQNVKSFLPSFWHDRARCLRNHNYTCSTQNFSCFAGCCWAALTLVLDVSPANITDNNLHRKKIQSSVAC